jgi:hypothetical protein
MPPVKFSLIAISIALLATPTFAAQPDGYFNFKTNQTYDQKNKVGAYSSQITQNGQFVGSGDNNLGIDQTNAPGSRADEVQALLAAQGQGRDK